MIAWTEKEFDEKYENKDTPIDFFCRLCGQKGDSRISDIRHKGYNCGNPDCRLASFEATSMRVYGEKNPAKSQQSKDKQVATCLKNRGTRYPMQHPDVFRKAMLKTNRRKVYTMKNGDQKLVLGYEDICLEDLEENYDFSLIFCGQDNEIPTIEYYMPNDPESHTYYPDIFIPEINTIIEVKSPYYLNFVLEENLQKAKYTMDKGYNFVFWVISNRKSQHTTFKFYNKETKKLEDKPEFFKDLISVQ
jgi:hypothetical protein